MQRVVSADKHGVVDQYERYQGSPLKDLRSVERYIQDGTFAFGQVALPCPIRTALLNTRVVLQSKVVAEEGICA